MKEKLGCEHGLLCSAEDVMRCWRVSLRVEEVCRAYVPGKKCCIHSVYRTHVNYKNGNPKKIIGLEKTKEEHQYWGKRANMGQK